MWVLGAELGPSGSEASTVSNEPLAYPSESLSFFLFSFDRVKGWLQSFYAAKDDRELSSLSFMPPYTQSSHRFEGSGRPLGSIPHPLWFCAPSTSLCSETQDSLGQGGCCLALTGLRTQDVTSDSIFFQRSHSPECCQSLVSRSLTCTVPLLNNMTSAWESAMKFSREKSGEAGATAMDTVPSCGDMLVRVLRMDTSLSCSSPHSRPSPPSDASAYSS